MFENMSNEYFGSKKYYKIDTNTFYYFNPNPNPSINTFLNPTIASNPTLHMGSEYNT
jgi:hypothetical protein